MSFLTLPIADAAVTAILPAKENQHGKNCHQYVSARNSGMVLPLSLHVGLAEKLSPAGYIYPTSILVRISRLNNAQETVGATSR